MPRPFRMPVSRRRSLPATPILVLGVLFVVLGAFPATPASAIQVGEEAPDFIVQDLNGDSPIVLSDHRGRVVVLNFFWTG